ncbi:recombinase family protein [Saccharopolyspora indica]|uniref:recombinase family protein n=1 Tax=Saccharopolyspora indica TaxID=1229659 RepID=UPI0022EA557E|nr:recombinase family protein [Saccharopolyspora indica]MDA3643769.1 recombinase family protein [Saccharopolyspora indica]
MTVRVLFAERISFDKKDSGSIETQDRKLLARLDEDPREVVLAGRAVDRSVSGDVDMPDRPALGKWLTEVGRDSWDELWVTTQDRLSRNDMHFMAFVFKILKWGKTLIVLDDPSLDLTTPEGRAIAHVKAIGPHKELERIKGRVQDSHDTRRWTARWHGGFPGYGYTTKTTVEVGEDGKPKEAKVLVLDEYSCGVLHEIKNWVVEERLPITICADRLIERGELTSGNLWRSRKEHPLRDETWTYTGLRSILRSPHLLGVKMRGGKPMTNRDGSYFVIAEPVFTPEEWEELQSALDERSQTNSRVNGASPLLGVGFCWECKRPLGQKVTVRKSAKSDKEYSYRWYRCRGNKNTRACVGVGMKADIVEDLLEERFLRECGKEFVTERTFQRGENHASEIKELERRIQRLREDRENGAYDEDPEYYAEKMNEYTTRKKEISKVPVRESGWVYNKLDVTYNEVWKKADDQEKRKLMVAAGVEFRMFRNGDQVEWDIYIPEDIKTRMKEYAGGVNEED